MSAVLTIAHTEARRIFVSPLAWAVLAVLQIVLGFVFWASVVGFANAQMMGNADSSFGVTDYVVAGTLVGFPMILMLLVMPLMTMRLFAEERRSGSIILLFSSPVSLTELVAGKFLGLAAFIAAVIGLLALMCASLLPATHYHLDAGRVAAGLLGLFLMLSSFGAAGLFVSTLTREPVIAAVIAFVVLLMAWLIQVPATLEGVPLPDLWNYLSLYSHMDSLRRGVFDSADIIYFLLFTLLFLWLAVLRLDMERN
jgi:ABC-2 type transport system permease protein